MAKICKTCNKEFIPKDDRPTRPAKFCSRKCIRNSTQFTIGHKLTPRGNKRWDNPASKAKWFKKDVHSYPFATTFKKGFTPWNEGKDFGGTQYTAKRIASLQKYRNWKKEIKIRDKFKCVQCGNANNLNIDHYPVPLAVMIKKYNIKKPQQAKQFEEFWNMNNGRTLCLSCHKETDTYGKNFLQKM